MIALWTIDDRRGGTSGLYGWQIVGNDTVCESRRGSKGEYQVLRAFPLRPCYTFCSSEKPGHHETVVWCGSEVGDCSLAIAVR